MAPVDKAEKPALKKRMSMTGIELKAGNDAHPDKGIPDIDVFGFVKFLPALVIQPAFACGMGGLFAHLIYTYGKTELYDRNIAKLADNEQGYVLLAAALFNLGVSHINTYPMLYKSMIMRFTSGNLRANMQIYKQTGAAAAEAGYVLLETQGPVGRYNRANRSLTHFTENSIPMAVLMVLCGGVFPLPTLALHTPRSPSRCAPARRRTSGRRTGRVKREGASCTRSATRRSATALTRPASRWRWRRSRPS